jgi:uncharacterized repeat protein (TIGR03803 family)
MKLILSTLLAILLLPQIIEAQPKLDVLVSFIPWQSAGANPYGGLTLGKNGDFYGTTADGNNDVGTVFKLTTTGTLTTLATFNYTNGANPLAGLTLGRDGNFYGTTYNYGVGGTVFRVTPEGSLTTLTNFNGTNGAYPMAALTLGQDRNFYGTTSGGGSYGFGTVFRVTPEGNLTTLATFNGTNGAYPMAALTLGRNHKFYGTTSGGGSYGCGTVFQMSAEGNLTTLATFNGTNGTYPTATLALGNGSDFYGTTQFGGLNTNEYGSGFGTVFRVSPEGNLITLANFDGTNGAYPQAGLTLASDGVFYGTTFGGGYNNGNIYRVTASGKLDTVVSFSGTNGSWPMSSLTIGKDGNFYGTTEEGGSSYNGESVGVGTVFKLIIPPTIKCFSLSNHVPIVSISSLEHTSVQIQTSTNLLLPWSVLTNLILTEGTNEFSDFAHTNSPARFYRIIVN